MTHAIDPALAILWGSAATLLLATLLVHLYGRRRLTAAMAWPVVTGRIIGCELVSYAQGGFRPQVSYSYVVAGQGYASDRLRPGGTPNFYRRANAEAAAARYAVGTPIAVHYNPARPADAAIELLPWNVWRLVFAVMAAAGVAVAALITFTVYS